MSEIVLRRQSCGVCYEPQGRNNGLALGSATVGESLSCERLLLKVSEGGIPAALCRYKQALVPNRIIKDGFVQSEGTRRTWIPQSGVGGQDSGQSVKAGIVSMENQCSEYLGSHQLPWGWALVGGGN